MCNYYPSSDTVHTPFVLISLTIWYPQNSCKRLKQSNTNCRIIPTTKKQDKTTWTTARNTSFNPIKFKVANPIPNDKTLIQVEPNFLSPDKKTPPVPNKIRSGQLRVTYGAAYGLKIGIVTKRCYILQKTTLFPDQTTTKLRLNYVKTRLNYD